MNKTVKNSAIYFAGTAIMAVLGFVSTMLLTRVLSEQVYALYGLLVTFSTTVVMFISFGYDASYMRFYYDHGITQQKFMLRCMKYPLCLSLVFFAAMLEPSHWLIRYIFGVDLTFRIAAAVSIYIFLSVLQRFVQLTARMEEYPVNYTLSNIVAKCGFLVIVAAVFYVRRDVSFDWIAVSFAVSMAAALLLNVAVFCKVRKKRSVQTGSVTDKALFSYGFPFMINNVLVLVIPMIEKIVIRDIAGWGLLSTYTAAAAFQTVILLLTNTVENIWNPIVFKNCNDKQKFRPILHNFGFAATVLMTIGLAFCILLRRWLVIFLAKNYHDVYIIAPAILYSSCFSLLMNIYSVGINIEKKTIHLIAAPVLQIVSSVAICFLLIPTLGLTGIGCAVLISVVVSRLYRILVGLKIYPTGVSEARSFILWGVSIAFALVSMYFTSFAADVCMFAALILIMLLIANKDIVEACRNVYGLVRREKTV